MSIPTPDLAGAPASLVLVGPGGSPLASRLRGLGHRVEELLPSDFRGGAHDMADVVAVLPDCPEPEKVGAVAAACARCVWFQERPAPPAVVKLLTNAGVPVVEGKDLVRECGA